MGGVVLLGLVAGGLSGGEEGPASDPSPTDYVSPNAEGDGAFGAAVAGVGDVNGEGTADVLVGAPGETVGPAEGAGRAYLFDGEEDKVLRALNASTLRAEDHFGTTVAGVGDLDGDETPDLAVGAGGPERTGRVHLYSGATGEEIRILTSPQATADGLFGRSIVGMGDVNGDGTADLCVGAIGEGEDRAYLFSGATGTLLYALTSPTEGHDHFGHLAPVGDINEDGVTDLLVGASTTTVDGRKEAGRVYLYSGADGKRLRALTNPDSTFGHFGYLVAAAGDVNSDDTPDAIVGAVSGPENGGRIYVFSGADGHVLRTIVPPAPEEDGYWGYSAVAVEDATGDGTLDLLLGTRVPVSGRESRGGAYLYEGRSGQRVRTLRSPRSPQNGRFGASLAGLQDPGGERVIALLLGAQGASVNGAAKAGRVYRFSVR